MRTPLLLLLLAVASMAGCINGDADEVTADEGEVQMPQLHGWVLDAVLAPVPNVEIEATVDNILTLATTDAEGFYGFDEFPTGTPVILIARAEGFVPQSKQTELAPDSTVLMNFSLARQPVIVPYHDTVGPYRGFLSCQYQVEAVGTEFQNECGAGSSDNQWSIPVKEDFAGGVIEIEWEEDTPFSHNMRATVECATAAGCGDFTAPFVDVTDASPLRVEISSLVASTYFPSGGMLLLKVYVDPNSEDSEAATGGAFAASQDFEAIASLFYHAPAPQGYSVRDQS